VSLYVLLTVDNAQSHVTAFRPISEAARSWSDDNVSCDFDISVILLISGLGPQAEKSD